ncbi:MAG: hypothetical protein ABI969_15010 [bacterium]
MLPPLSYIDNRVNCGMAMYDPRWTLVKLTEQRCARYAYNMSVDGSGDSATVSFWRRSVLAAALLAAPLHAQASSGISMQFSQSVADGRGGDYTNRTNQDVVQVNVGISYAVRSHWAVVAQLEADGDVRGQKVELICATHVGGTMCIPGFPRFMGVNVTAGVLSAPVGRAELRFLVGPGVYSAGCERVLTVCETVDAAVFVTHHIGLTYGQRVVTIPNF